MSNIYGNHDFPKDGWKFSKHVDWHQEVPGGYLDKCDMCGRKGIRHSHFYSNPAYPGGIKVGCCCAERLDDRKGDPSRRQAKASNLSKRRESWPNGKWHTSKKGNHYRKIKGHKAGYSNGIEGWQVWIIHPEGYFSNFPERYETEDEAKMALFDKCEEVLG